MSTPTVSDAFLQKVNSGLSQHAIKVDTYAGELSITVDVADLRTVMKVLKNDFDFNLLCDITAVDHYREEKRFETSYNLYSLENKKRLRIKTFVEEESPLVPTVTDLWPAADWYERECWDMMGIRFSDHPDLRRIYMPEDFEYFPLRKEFPLIGIPGSIQLPEKDAPKGYR